MKKLTLCLAITSALGLTGCDDTTLQDVQDATSETRAQNTTAADMSLMPRVSVVFDPGAGLLPIPNDLLFSGTADFTLEMPDEVAAKLIAAANGEEVNVDWGNPAAALGALDGWGTQNSFSIGLEYATGTNGETVSLDAASIATSQGDAVAIYKVTMYPNLGDAQCADPAKAAQMCKATEKLQYGVDYVASVIGGNIVVTPLKAFEGGQSYAVVLTTAIKDSNGNPLAPSSTYAAVRADITTNPLVDPTRTDLTETEAGILSLQTVFSSYENTLIADQGVDRGDIVFSQVFTAQSAAVAATDPLQVTKALNALTFSAMAEADPASVVTPIASQGFTVAQAFAAQMVPGFDNPADPTYLLYNSANVYGAQIEMPYYLGTGKEALTSRWEAACDSGIVLANAPAEALAAATPGPYHELCSQFQLADLGLDTERHLTKYSPIPVTKSTQVVDVQITIPNVDNANIIRGAQGLPGLSGKPDTGWPVVILQHGITSKKEDMLAATGFLSMFGFATVAIDHPLHGSRGFEYTENDVTYTVNASTNSATDYLNLASLLTARDNLRQSAADGLRLRLALNAMADFTNPLAPDLAIVDPSKVYYLGHSLGAITGTTMAAVANTDSGDAALDAVYDIDAVMLANPGGSIANFLTQSGSFGPLVNASVIAGLGNEATEALLAFTEPSFYAQIVMANPQCLSTDMNVVLVCAYNAYLGSATPEQLAAGQAGVAEFAFAAQAVIEGGDPTNYASLLAGSGTPVLMIEMVGDGALNLPDQVIPNAVAGNPMAGTSGLAYSLGLPTLVESAVDAENTPKSGLVKYRYGSHSTVLSPSAGDLPEPYITLFGAVNQQISSMMSTFFLTNGTSIILDDGILAACAIEGGSPETCSAE